MSRSISKIFITLCLVTRSISLAFVVLVYPIVLFECPLVVLVSSLFCPLVVLVCPLVVYVCLLVVLVVISVGLFITDLEKNASKEVLSVLKMSFIKKNVKKEHQKLKLAKKI